MGKRLYRSRKEKVIGGVAGGIADYFSIDPTLVRILFVVTVFAGGSGILAYIILWIVIPEEPLVFDTAENKNSDTEVQDEKINEHLNAINAQRQKRRVFFGVALVILGMFFLAGNLIPHIDFFDLFPVILIIIGISLLVTSRS